MLADAEQRDESWFRDRVFDVCVVGGGPAGITLARTLANHGWTVGLFEGGGLTGSPESQDIYDGKIVGHEYFPLDATRLRFFGGTSNHWSGWCRPLEAEDFLPLPYNRYSGWPIRKVDLDPYAEETQRILDFDPELHPRLIFSDDPGSLKPFMFRWSAPTRFGPKYRPEIEASDKIHLFLNANLVDLDLAESRRGVASATFRSYERPEPFTVRAKYFALCLGGLENARFLLNATRQVPAGIGNERDLVGRFFSEHCHFKLGYMVFDYEIQKTKLESQFYHPTREFLLDKKILNFGLRLYMNEEHDPDSQPRRMLRNAICSNSLLIRVASEIQGSGVVCNDGSLHIQTEQELQPDSRVTLGEDRDRFGQRRIALDWRLSELDKKTMTVAALEFGRLLAVKNVGRLRLLDWVLDPKPTFPTLQTDELAGHHPMCTTRMSDDPAQGVVDKDCRLHTVDNLYIGGCSVFASTGYANPTYTIVQLALRLGDHLDQRLSKRG